jgi:hypothetical protein
MVNQSCREKNQKQEEMIGARFGQLPYAGMRDVIVVAEFAERIPAALQLARSGNEAHGSKLKTVAIPRWRAAKTLFLHLHTGKTLVGRHTHEIQKARTTF